MSKRNIALTIAVTALTFLVLLIGSKFYEVYAPQNPLEKELVKYHIKNLQYNRQEKIVVLFVQKDTDLRAALNDIFKKIGTVDVEVHDNPSQKLKTFYNNEELYIMQYIAKKEYGTLKDFLEKKAIANQFTVYMTIDDHYLYLKIVDGSQVLYKLYPRAEESGV